MPNNELQDLLGARFENFTHSSDDAVWGAIEAQLDEEKSDKIGIWFWIFNGIAATLLASVMIQSVLSKTTLDSGQLQMSTQSTAKDAKVETKSDISALSKASIPSENTTLKESSPDSKETTTSSGVLSAQQFTNNDLPKTQKPQKISKKAPTFDNRKIPFSSDKENESVNSEVNALQCRSIQPDLASPIKIQSLVSINANHNSSYWKQMPISLGFELSFLRKNRTELIPDPAADPWFSNSISKLTENRYFEWSVFSQFDLTRRFSTSIGFGYSQSDYISQKEGQLSSFALEAKLQQKVFFVPVRIEYNLIQRNRFGLHAGITFQTEFGKIVQSEKYTAPDSWVGTSGSLQESGGSVISIEKFRQFSLQPSIGATFQITPRIVGFINMGYRMYTHHSNSSVAPQEKLNYLNSNTGVKFRIN